MIEYKYKDKANFLFKLYNYKSNILSGLEKLIIINSL